MKLSEVIAPCFYGVHADLRAERHSEYFLKGGRGSGKSSFASIEIILGLMKHPDANAIVYRKVAATLRESVFEQMLWAIDALGLSDYFEGKVSPMEIVCKHSGQKILFRGADDPSKSKSIKLSKGWFKYLWIEELSEFHSMADVRTIKASVFRGGGRCAAIYSYNPPSAPAAWINAEAMLPRSGRLVHHSDYRQMPPKWLGESFLAEAEALAQSNERAYRHVYLGEATGSGGQVFDNLSLRTVGAEERAAFDRFWNGLDFGFAVDPDAFVRVHYDVKSRRLFIAEEFVGVRTPADRLAEVLKAHCGMETIRCDCADPRMIQALRERELNAVGVKKGAGSVREGMRWLQELAEIVIDPARCPNAAREFSSYEYESDGLGYFRSDYPDRNNHLIDATRYALEEVIRHRRARTLDRCEMGII